MKRPLIILLLAVKGFAGEFIAVPITPDDAASSRPFALEISNFSSMRYQQVYDASAFTRLEPFGGGIITRIYFENDNVFGRGFISTLHDIQINLSVSSRGPDNLSTTFSENIGLHETVVFARGSLTLRSVDPGGLVTPIELQQPFYYNPAEGNLLLDVWNFRANSPGGCYAVDCAPPFEAADLFSDSVSSVWVADVNSAVGLADTKGLHTIFDVTPIPEPSAWLLLVLGLGAAVILRRGNFVRRGT